MKKITVNELVEIIGAELKVIASHDHRESSNEITGVSTDTRTIEPGDCFFAIQGPNFDGHDYLAEAFEKNASCAVISKSIDELKLTKKPLLKVRDTINALGSLALHYREKMNFKVIAITGSAGKTTTRQIIHTVLAQRFYAHQSPKNFNNNIGLPLTILSADPDTEIIVAELGSNQTGEISYLSNIARPDIALITNIRPAHLAGFGYLGAIIKEKASITDGLRKNGMLIVKAGFKKRLEPFIDKNINCITFGTSESSDINAKNISLAGTASCFTIDNTTVELPLPGKANLRNALAAWAVCRQFGIKIDEFARAIKTIKPIPMRTEIIQLGNLTILNDCYNANPASMKNALQILPTLNTNKNRRLVFICADMNELGQHAKSFHKKLGKNIANANIDLLLTVGTLSKITAGAAKKSAEQKLKIKSFHDTYSACNNLQKFIKDSDIILVKGSREAKLELAVEKLKQLFSSG